MAHGKGFAVGHGKAFSHPSFRGEARIANMMYNARLLHFEPHNSYISFGAAIRHLDTESVLAMSTTETPYEVLEI